MDPALPAPPAAKPAERCLVFGGSGALGRVVCEMLAAEGCRVAFTYRTGEAVARDLAKRLAGAVPLYADLARIAEVERAVDEAAAALGGVEAFCQCAAIGATVECAGAASAHRIPRIDEESWDRMLAVNAKSTFFAVRRLVPPLSSAGGNVVLVGSVDVVKPAPTPVHYAAAKGALAGMTRAMAKELGEVGIRVNMVAPGILEDGLTRTLPRNLVDEYVKHCGLKRVGKLAEVAGVIVWLARHNTYVTGQTILVDGAL